MFGVLTFVEAPNVDKNLPTPYIGLWERINIAAFLVWILVFANILLRTETKTPLPGSNKNMTGKKLVARKQYSKETI